MTQAKHNYIAGNAYKMRSGYKIYFVGENPTNNIYPLVFVDCDNNFYSHKLDGKHQGYRGYDIIGEWQEPKKVKGWVNVYLPPSFSTYQFTGIFETSYEAAMADIDKEHLIERIACISIEFTEGDGL